MAANNREMTSLERFRRQPRNTRRLSKADFDLTNGDANTRSLIASYESPKPFEIREESFRLMLAYHEAFAHTGATTAEQTYSLAYSPVDTPNTISAEAYAGSTRLTLVDSTPGDDEFAVDFTTDEITVDVDTDETIHVFYFPVDGVQIEIEKKSPGTMGNLTDIVYDDITTDLWVRNQNQNPPEFGFTRSAYESVVPKKWELNIYANGPYGFDWDDSDTDTSGTKTVDGVEPSNVVIDIPIEMGRGNVRNLGSEVAADMAGRFG